jgi:hypothetical protein
MPLQKKFTPGVYVIYPSSKIKKKYATPCPLKRVGIVQNKKKC